MDPSPTGLKTQILDKAAADPDFRKRLLADPRVAVEAFLGFPVPGDLQLEVLEETAGKVYLVVPPAADASPIALDDADLDATGISGGRTSSWFSFCD